MNADCLFIHAPKTGGRSVLDACGVPFMIRHKTIQDYISEIGLSSVESKFKFSTVRNPWDRAYSWWRFFVERKGSSRQHAADFDGWVVHRIENENRKLSLGSKRPLDQMSYYKDQRGRVLIDKFLRFESLSDDFSSISSRVGVIKPIGNIGSSHRMEKPLHYRVAFKTQKAIDLVGRLNRDLIDQFGYTY